MTPPERTPFAPDVGDVPVLCGEAVVLRGEETLAVTFVVDDDVFALIECGACSDGGDTVEIGLDLCEDMVGRDEMRQRRRAARRDARKGF